MNDLRATLTLQINALLMRLFPYKKDHAVAYSYFAIIDRAIHLEAKFEDDFELCNKEVAIHLKDVDFESAKDIGEICSLFLELYDVHHPVRFAVETMDSIESVRLFLIDNPNYLRDCL